MTTEEKTSKKKSTKKKRKVSKHILQANQEHAELEKARASEALPIDESEVQAATAGALTKTKSSSRPNKTPPGAPNQHTKDSKEAAGYLTNWKNHRKEWKFNKNTQSWLIRHMYEADKVSKGTFTLLLDYLEGLQGKGAKERIVEDATRRALRYKEFEEGGTGTEKEVEKETTVKFASDTKEAPAEEEEGKKKRQKLDPTATDDEKRWNELDDHDKRKEYKRARKVLETLKSE